MQCITFVLYKCLYHSTYIIKSCEYQTGSSSKREKLELQQIVFNNMTLLDDAQKVILHSLEQIKDGNQDPTRWRAFFDEADEDGSGEIDREELSHLLTRLGFVVSEGFIDEVLEHYGSDDSGQMCLPGFLNFVKSQYTDACNRIEEMTSIRVMALSTANTIQYKPPRTGMMLLLSATLFYNLFIANNCLSHCCVICLLHGTGQLILTIIDGLATKSNVRIVKHGVAEIAGEIGGSEKMTLLHFTMDSAMFRLSEAFTVYKMLYADGANKNRCIADVLQRLNSPTEVRAFLRKTLSNFDRDMVTLRKYIGAAMSPMLGVYNGYYCLDLANPLDRCCLKQLLMHNEKVISKRKLAGKCDTSQHQNWSCFRNEMKNGQSHEIDQIAYEVIPMSGKISFDFFSIDRPDRSSDTVSVTDKRFATLISMKTDLLPYERIGDALALMSNTKSNLARALLFSDRVIYECAKPRALVGFVVMYYVLQVACIF